MCRDGPPAFPLNGCAIVGEIKLTETTRHRPKTNPLYRRRSRTGPVGLRTGFMQLAE